MKNILIFIFTVYIDQSISLRKFLILHQSSLDNVRYNQFLSIFFQIVIALGIAQERCFFTHWDLHIDNVILFFTKQPRKVCHKLYNYKCCFSSNYNIVPYMVDYEYSHGIHTGSNQRISFSFWNQYNSRKTYFRSSLVRKLYSCGILGTFISSVDILRLLCSIQWFCILLLKKKTIYSQGKNTLLYRVYFFVNFLLRKAFGLSFSYRQKHHSVVNDTEMELLYKHKMLCFSILHSKKIFRHSPLSLLVFLHKYYYSTFPIEISSGQEDSSNIVSNNSKEHRSIKHLYQKFILQDYIPGYTSTDNSIYFFVKKYKAILTLFPVWLKKIKENKVNHINTLSFVKILNFYLTIFALSEFILLFDSSPSAFFNSPSVSSTVISYEKEFLLENS